MLPWIAVFPEFLAISGDFALAMAGAGHRCARVLTRSLRCASGCGLRARPSASHVRSFMRRGGSEEQIFFNHLKGQTMSALTTRGRSSSRVTSRHFDHGNGSRAFTFKLFRSG